MEECIGLCFVSTRNPGVRKKPLKKAKEVSGQNGISEKIKSK